MVCKGLFPVFFIIIIILLLTTRYMLPTLLPDMSSEVQESLARALQTLKECQDSEPKYNAEVLVTLSPGKL